MTDKGLSGEDTEAFFAGPDLGLALVRPARKDEKTPRYFPNWLRQRIATGSQAPRSNGP